MGAGDRGVAESEKILAPQRTPEHRAGGLNSGQTRVDKFTSEEQVEIARNAPKAWWRKRNPTTSQVP